MCNRWFTRPKIVLLLLVVQSINNKCCCLVPKWKNYNKYKKKKEMEHSNPLTQPKKSHWIQLKIQFQCNGQWWRQRHWQQQYHCHKSYTAVTIATTKTKKKHWNGNIIIWHSCGCWSSVAVVTKLTKPKRAKQPANQTTSKKQTARQIKDIKKTLAGIEKDSHLLCYWIWIWLGICIRCSFLLLRSPTHMWGPVSSILHPWPGINTVAHTVHICLMLARKQTSPYMNEKFRKCNKCW